MKKLLILSCTIIFSYFFDLSYVRAEGQMLSVTPPLIQIDAQKGELWPSTLKVVNGNPYPLTVYTQVVNFQAYGEAGQGRFLPILEDQKEHATLAHWIHIDPGPHVIPPEQTAELSYFVEIPKDAPPGGHYAAIFVSTEPDDSKEKLALKTSQAITSLVFLRIEGDVDEKGQVREFSPIDSFLQKPEVDFSLRFENKGNVHLQPRGAITIYNMWGVERGTIPINYQSAYGNVLPQSIRDFRFTWKSDFQLSDIGRYKAIVNLSFGENGMQSETATTYFWVVPLKGTLITLSILFGSILLIVLMIKAYVRRMLALAGVDPDARKDRTKKVHESESDLKKTEDTVTPLHKKGHKATYKAVAAPIKSGVLDLRQRLDTADETKDVVRTMWSFVVQYKYFFISVCVLVTIFVVAVLYITSVTTKDTDYSVIINEGDTATEMNGEEIEQR